MEKPILCVHAWKENITYSVAGKKVYKDQCMKCYDDSVSNFIYKFFSNKEVC